jgi:hypothetical protein
MGDVMLTKKVSFYRIILVGERTKGITFWFPRNSRILEVQYVKGGELLIYHEYLEHDGTPKTAPSEFRLVDVHEQISADWDFVATVRRFGDGRAVWFLYRNTRKAVPVYELLKDRSYFESMPKSEVKVA